MREQGQGALTADLYPHPDDVFIDPRTGEVDIRGPMSAEEGKRDEVYFQLRDIVQKDFTACEAVLAVTTDETEREALSARMAQQHMTFELCNLSLPKRLQVGLMMAGDDEE